MAAPVTVSLAKSRIGVSLPFLVALFVFGTVLCWGQAVLVDPDTYLHISVGRWILLHHAVPHVGIFSETMPNAPWVADEWLSEAILGLLYSIWGWNGLVFATAGSFAAALAILTRYLLNRLEPVHALIGTLSAAGMMLPHLLSRPHIFTLPILVVWFGTLVDAREHDRSPSLWLLPLMTLWANLHGSFMFGLVFVGIFAGEALFLARGHTERLAALKQWGLFGVLATAASVITPFGVFTLWLPFHVLQMKFAVAALGEWESTNFAQLQPLELWMMGGLALALINGVRLPFMRVVMILLLLHMSLVHRRNADLLGFVAPLLLAPSIGAFVRNHFPERASRPDHVFSRLAMPANFRGVVIAATVLLVASVLYLSHPLVRTPDPNAPTAALAAARENHLTDGRVFNQYGMGDYLIFSGIAPFIDGRAELYGDAFVKQNQQAVWGITDELPKLLDKYHITWTIFAAKGTAATLMGHLAGWRRVYADDTAVVYARAETSDTTRMKGAHE